MVTIFPKLLWIRCIEKYNKGSQNTGISALCLKYRDEGHLKKKRPLPNLKPSQKVPKHPVFKLCQFHEKINGQFFAKGQNLLYNA